MSSLLSKIVKGVVGRVGTTPEGDTSSYVGGERMQGFRKMLIVGMMAVTMGGCSLPFSSSPIEKEPMPVVNDLVPGAGGSVVATPEATIHYNTLLPTTKITLKEASFVVELARTEAEQEKGLMKRTELPPSAGMLFVYEEAGPRAFWMKDTYLPLDILFFDSEQRLVDGATLQPCREDPCATYVGKVPAQYVLEVAEGTAAALDLKEGDTFTLETSYGK